MGFSTFSIKSAETTNTLPPHGFPSSLKIQNSPLFRHQDQLEQYPLTSLDSTLFKLKNSMLALAGFNNNETEREIDTLISKFKAEQGPFLHNMLKNRVNEKKGSYGWFYEWWNDYAYLKDREPLVFYVSYFYAFKGSMFLPFVSTIKNEVERQCRTASLIAASTIIIRDKVLAGELEPDRSNSHSLCSHMYKYLFNTCRIAKKPYDTTIVYDIEKYTHFIVLFKNKFFKINGFDNESSSKISYRQFEK